MDTRVANQMIAWRGIARKWKPRYLPRGEDFGGGGQAPTYKKFQSRSKYKANGERE